MTTVLVDTYDAHQGIDRVISAVRQGASIRAVRIDSEPLLELARDARRRLDSAGLGGIEIFASGGLDDARISELLTAGAPIDAFGVGSALVCPTDKPAVDLVYKLVECAGAGRAKYSAGKTTLPGRKQVYRTTVPAEDVLDLRDVAGPGTPLLELLWKDGRRRYDLDVGTARRRAADVLERLPDDWFSLPGPRDVPLPVTGAALDAEAARVHGRIFEARG